MKPHCRQFKYSINNVISLPVDIMTKPKISVIIPTHNRAELLRKAIASVLNQTFKDFELIIVDEASTDNTEEIVKEFMKEDDRIRYLRYELNSKKPSIARNRGIAVAKGEYLAFLDDDDVWLSRKLEMQIELAEQQDLDLVGCNYLLVNEKGEMMGKIIFPEWIRENLLKALMRGVFYPNLSGLIVRRNILRDVGLLDEKLTWGEDLELVIRLIRNDVRFNFVKDPCFKYTIHTNRVSTRLNWINKAKDYEYIAMKHKDFLINHPKEFSELLRWIARAYCYGGLIEKGKRYYKESIKFNPTNYKSLVSYIASFIGFEKLSKIYRIYRRFIA